MSAEKAIEWLRRHSLARFMLLCLVLSLLFAWTFRTQLMLCYIPSESMETTLDIGDFAIGTRFNADDIHRYDIMVFRPPDHPGVYYIKRVIGLPGETVTVKDGSVYADGKRLKSSFVNDHMDSDGDGTYRVPKGCYFMMGDNRNNSNDSRFWTHKYVPLASFAAKAQVVVFPFNHAKKI